MVNGTDVVEVVRKLFGQLNRPVSIEEVAEALGVSADEIAEIVLHLLELGLLEGSFEALQPGPTNGLY